LGDLRIRQETPSGNALVQHEVPGFAPPRTAALGREADLHHRELVVVTLPSVSG
jgi:hypothetical protein